MFLSIKCYKTPKYFAATKSIKAITAAFPIDFNTLAKNITKITIRKIAR